MTQDRIGGGCTSEPGDPFSKLPANPRRPPSRLPRFIHLENAMTTIRHADLVDSVAAALQYISYYHPADYIAHLARAY